LTETLNNVLLGTSGWSYREWIGPFYKKKEKSMLRAYSKVFKTVEIDSTFYAYPSKGMVMGWVKYSPEDFVFAAKLPKLITHEKMLNLEDDVEEDLDRFCELIRPLLLNGKLGCLLIQLPPKYKYDLEHLEDFFRILPKEFKFAVEFRNLSWIRNETWNLLKNYGPWFNYRYNVDELRPWIPRVRRTAEGVKKVYGYFNNHFHGYAVENCLQVLEMLGVLTLKQTEAKTIAENYFKRSTKMKKTTLETFVEPRETTLKNLLENFIDKPRLKRAQRIEDKELTIQEATEDQIKAMIRDYRIFIDLKNRFILHDCADWSRMLPRKRFCKHLGKLLLSLDREKTLKILKQIYANKETWEFKPFAE